MPEPADLVRRNGPFLEKFTLLLGSMFEIRLTPEELRIIPRKGAAKRWKIFWDRIETERAGGSND